MGREVRKVPANWQHPKNSKGDYIPLFGRSYTKAIADWNENYAQWRKGFRQDFSKGGTTWQLRQGDEINMSFKEWHGDMPVPEDYMPEWDESEQTHLMMYEDTSEGTPISPAFKTPEELAHWLADNDASAFAGLTASYEEWLATCKKGWAPSMVATDGIIKSGVEFMKNK